jgi:Escherichia/Staphylococcus phage prohead protease
MSENGKQILRRTFQAPLETKDGRVLVGCIVPYGEATKVADSPDGPSYFEVFEPGAFRRQVKAADKLELRYEHRDDLAHSVGIGRKLWDEAAGLFGEFKVHATEFGNQALELVREGVLPGFSVEFSDRFTHWNRTDDGTVVRANCLLHSVGLVRTPAYAGALVTEMRSRRKLLEELKVPIAADEQLERLRSVGISV